MLPRYPRQRKPFVSITNTSSNRSSGAGGSHLPHTSTSMNEGEGDGSKVPKVRKRHKVHTLCCQCTMWEQTGSDSNLTHLHSYKQYMRHPISEEQANLMSNYMSHENVAIELNMTSCICNGCFRDWERNRDNRENVKPRWVKVKEEFYVSIHSPTKHCIFCCSQAQCQCGTISQWGPDQWHGHDTLQTWKRLLVNTGKISHGIPSRAEHICRHHFKVARKIITSRKCSICSVTYNDSWWKLICEVTENLLPLCEAFSINVESLSHFDWICKHCRIYYNDGSRLHDILEADRESTDPLNKKRGDIITDSITKLTSEGILFTNSVTQEFRNYLTDSDHSIVIHKMCNTFAKFLERCMKKHMCSSYHPQSKKSGTVYFLESTFKRESIPYVFNLYIKSKDIETKYKEITTTLKTTVTPLKIKQMLKKQAKKFPTTHKFDFRTLRNAENVMDLESLDQHFNKELIELIECITRSDSEKEGSHSALYKIKKNLRIRMIIGMLCMTMNPQSCFLQTALGLICYAYGLREAGFDMLNAVGCICSMDHVRQHGDFWSKNREAVTELNPKLRWRISIDNLNFKMKYAKSLSTEDNQGSLKKMLNLLTCQTSTQELTLHASDTKFYYPFKPSIDARLVSETNFTDSSCQYLSMLQDASFCSTVQRLAGTPISFNESLLESFQKKLPHWTPKSPSNIVFATVEEGNSSTESDIHKYLVSVKEDLKIGQVGYPSNVIIAGDQQTFALMKNLKIKYPQIFDWIYIMHGDWHLLKLTSELLRDMLWDGGLKEFSHRCGYKKELYQWQEIHLMLVATYETLLRKAVFCYISIPSHKEKIQSNHFWEWISKLTQTSYLDQISRFWSSALVYINGYIGYYFSIRTGNWLLRNSCLKLITPLFFAYSRFKYEDLSTSVLFDSLTLPSDLLYYFLEGNWTVSYKGRPYHNIALDEAHECVINLRLKLLTSRPSHFRTVQLSDFMAYMDKVIDAFEGLLSVHTAAKKQSSKRFVCQRSTLLDNFIKDGMLFSSTPQERTLCNVFSNKPQKLTSEVINDLLNFGPIGLQRMNTFIRQYVLTPPRELPPQKKKRSQKLQTFTIKPDTARTKKTKIKQLTDIVKNNMAVLQAHGITAQSSPYPLAISDLSGDIRQCPKSTFRLAVLSHEEFKDWFITQKSPIYTNPQQLCVIIDFMYLLHMPPPPDVLTFYQYFRKLWERSVGKYAVTMQCKQIYIVIDKPEFLPPPRSIVHHSRALRAQTGLTVDPNIEDQKPIPHDHSYVSLLANSTNFREKLLTYLSTKIITEAKLITCAKPFDLVLDTPSFPTPILVSNGATTNLQPNQHGEADYAMWHHAIHSSCSTILILASDTDTWTNGIGIHQYYLGNKAVYIERGNSGEFVHINAATVSLQQHPKLRNYSHPGLLLLSLYVLSGCDYVSGFYGYSKKTFMEVLFDNIDHICTTQDGLLRLDQHGHFKTLDTDCCIRLICAVYFSKQKKFFHYKSVGSVYDALITFPDATQSKDFLSRVGYDLGQTITCLKDWHNFLRKVTFHATKITNNHEAKVIPSWDALIFHCKRATYVIKLIMCTPLYNCPTLSEITSYGWKSTSSGVEIDWGTFQSQESLTFACSCKTGCITNRCNCHKHSKMCSARCKCQDCKNTATSNEDPHSNSEPESETDSEEYNIMSTNHTTVDDGSATNIDYTDLDSLI